MPSTDDRMLPSISALVTVEMVRDGGSFAATFSGMNGSKYGLRMQVISDRGPSGELIRRGYERPVVFERIEVHDQQRWAWEAINEVELSWQHAVALLHQLRTHVRSEPDARSLAAMIECAEGEGKCPASLDEVAGAVGPV